MNKTFGFIAAFFVGSLFSCQDTRDEARSTTPDLAQLKTVGMQIPTETGARWIEAYNARYNNSGRTGVLYSINSSELEAMLSSVESLVGVAFHYGIDDTGEKHIIAIPVEDGLRLWTSIPGRVYLDANTSTQISQSTAEKWATRYRNGNGSSIWFHYFGRNLFDEILTTTDFVAMDIIPAINDLDLSPQLLLVVESSENLLGRAAAESPVYDASYPCPKCSVE